MIPKYLQSLASTIPAHELIAIERILTDYEAWSKVQTIKSTALEELIIWAESRKAHASYSDHRDIYGDMIDQARQLEQEERE